MSAFTAIDSSLLAPVGDLPPVEVIFGRSRAMQLVRQKVERAASTNVPLLIQGESGTGKEVMAKLVHSMSPWKEGPFVKINCPAIPATLIESELFGYERGAFTGAYASKPGRVELAHQGTLFLDEIAELDAALQAKLLQLLQDGQVCRIGAQEDKRFEVRVICATNRNLEQEIEAGNFRRDLFYRINVVNIKLPSLVERREDIPQLVNYFLEGLRPKFEHLVRPLSSQLMQMLLAYDWPGNVRQLENMVKRFVILGSEEALSSELISRSQSSLSSVKSDDGTMPLKKLTQEAVGELERRVILKALQANHWNRKLAARDLKISYRALLYKIKQAGLPSKRKPSQPSTVPGLEM
ncbi:MAG TPA: sigma-54 dependent transcriptional regulator [Terriglobia bacterium]|jgi:transcriptional regulator with PAS, ATPase and Fis domain|nr:sigma-54 dependent transcriptional regulator [Terriglobia bacterium]